MFGFHHRGGPRGPRDFGRHAMRGRRDFGAFSVEWDVQDERGGRRGRGRGRVFSNDELRLVLLKLIEPAPRHGYDLIRAIEELTGGAYAPSPGVVYPTLTLLADMELIVEQQSEGARKLFAITPAGTDHLAEKVDEVAALIARLEGLAELRDRSNRGPVRRAIGNLRSALHAKLADADRNEELPHEIAAILDEAVRKIERL